MRARHVSTEQRARLARRIDGIPCPAHLGYIVRWASEIHGRSGLGMYGFAPVTYATIETWARLSGIDDLTAGEMQILFMLDGVLCAAKPDDPPPPTELAEPAVSDQP